jgi:8-oxo-dGTP pyrophosphatase MutT (NUDIX family)
LTFHEGRLDKGEKSPDAAIREVEEETGWRSRIEAELPKLQYWFQREGQRVKKTVRWFLMAGRTSRPTGPRSGGNDLVR